MKILSPLDTPDEVEKLANAGAREFYCGLLEETWYEKYPVISINRRPAGKGHFRKFTDLQHAVSRSHHYGIPVYFTLNEHYYINAQYPLITQYIEGALDAGVDAFIVSDYGLMNYIREHKYTIPVHISTGGTVFNWRAAALYKEYGAVNITFPRHLTIDEIRDIIDKIPNIEKTVFILNSRCINVDGFCTFQHGLSGKKVLPMFRNACMLPYDVTLHCDENVNDTLTFVQQASMIEKQKIWEKVHVDDHPCGACALYEFNDMGITSVKIVGRGNPLERKVKDITYIKNLIDNVCIEKQSKKEFVKKTRQLYQETYHRTCRLHMCYYPSVMFD